MKIFISGATGFVGKILTRRLAEEGHIIHAFYRSAEKIRDLNHKNIKWCQGSLDNTVSIDAAMDRCDLVYHTAAYARAWARDSSVFFRHNVSGTKNILDSAEKNGVKKIVYVSTAGVFGPSGTQLTTENTPYPDRYFTHYERSKFEAEQLVLNYADRGLPVVLVNPTRIYGPGPLVAANGTVIIVDNYIKGKWRFIPGNGKNIGNYVYVLDVVDGLVRAMEYGRPGERYLLSGEDASFNDMIAVVAELSGKTYRMIKIPQFLLFFVSSMMLVYARLTGTEPIIVPGFIKKYSFDWKVSCEKARKELGYEPRTLKQGISNTLEWIRQGYKLNY
jgi:nucleoside-diphosphate-sugar epimerase